MCALAMVAVPLCASSAPAACMDPQPNIILFVADDLGQTDLPFINPPIEWRDDSVPPDGIPDPVNSHAYRTWRPDLNRFAARALADRATGESIVRPIDQGAIPFGYSSVSSCSGADLAMCRADALEGHGGLAAIAEGVRFDRFYSASAVCSPSRASIFTGLHVSQHRVQKTAQTASTDEVTIAEYLKQGCRSQNLRQCWDWEKNLKECECLGTPSPGACGYPLASQVPGNAPCYTTGFIGKWHIGREGDKAPWAQGFDEFIGFLGGERGYFDEGALTCSSGKPRCSDSTAPCDDDADCAPSGTCRTDLGLYVGGNPAEVGKCGDSIGPNDPDCCAPRADTYQVPGRKSSQASVCNDNTGRARDAGNGAGCNFEARVFRDLAKDFVRRHAGGQPFFLVVAWHSVHAPLSAPERTKNHYETADIIPAEPRQPVEFWAVLEELDAAVGQILDELAAQHLTDKTLVLFTSDNGRSDPSAYGNPRLRGHKFDMLEGGIRMGLLARPCSETGPPLDFDAYVGGHVDLFPTIAEAAGFPVTGFNTGGPTPAAVLQRICREGRKRCASDDDCVGSDKCVDDALAGRSLYPAINETYQSALPPPPVDFTFSMYNAANAVVSRPGYYTDHPVDGATVKGGVCGYQAPRYPLTPSRPSDILRAGSCRTCDPSQPDSCAGEPCLVLGPACVLPGGSCKCLGTACSFPPTCVRNRDCGLHGVCVHDPSHVLEPCEPGTCARGSCEQVGVECTTCTPATWKLYRKGHRHRYLFDLATNPEEATQLDCRRSSDPDIQDIKSDLDARLTSDLQP